MDRKIASNGRGIIPLEERFWSKVEMIPFHSCWEWMGAPTMTNRSGSYGEIRLGGRKDPKILAHRASWIIHFGAIPEGKFVCHKCDNPGCVRPDHLFLGNNQDNMNDMKKKKRQYGKHPRFTKDQRNQMRRLAKKHTYQEVAKMFDTTSNYVNQLVSYRRGINDRRRDT